MVKTKKPIFNQIVDIVSSDYSGWYAKKASDYAEGYEVTDEMPDENFAKIVQSYLMDFHDRHVKSKPKSDKAFTMDLA